MLKTNRNSLVVLTLLLMVFVQVQAEPTSDDPLPSWNDGQVKTSIINFVNCVTDPNCKGYVPPFYRVATFDLDGTLMCEQPMAFQMYPILDKLANDVERDPALANVQPWKAVVEHDTTFIKSNYDLVLGTAYKDTLQSVFRDAMYEYMSTEKHERFDVPYLDLIYRPMMELFFYLDENGFDVWICSGSMQGFIRSFSEGSLGVFEDHVIGSGSTLDYNDNNEIYRTGDFYQPINLKNGKPVNIQRWTAKQPILAFGNSSGDIQMLEYAMSNQYTHLAGIIVHDCEKEYVYRYPDLEEMGREQGWLEVSMQNDFNRIFMGETE